MPNPTTRLQFPGGKFVDVPGELSPDEVQAYLSQHPALGGYKVQEGAPGAPPAAAPSTPKPPAHPQGWGEWLAESGPTIGGLAGGALAAGAEFMTGGLATPLVIGLPAGGAALGEFARDQFRRARGDSRASTSAGDEALNMAKAFAVEGATSALMPGAAKLATAAGRGAKNAALSLAIRAINPEMAALRKMPGAANKTVEAAESLGHFVLDNDIAHSATGASKLQKIIDTISGTRGKLVQRQMTRSGAKSEAAKEIMDPVLNARGYSYLEPFLNSSTNLKAQKAVADLGAELMDPANKVMTTAIPQMGKVPARTIAKALNAEELMKATSSTAAANRAMFTGGNPDQLGLAVAKMNYSGQRDALNRLMQGYGVVANPTHAVAKLPALAGRSFEDLGRQQGIALQIREAMGKTLTKDEALGSLSMPSAFLAYSHPLLAGAHVALKSPGVTRRAGSFAARKLFNPVAPKLGTVGAKLGSRTAQNIGQTALRAAKWLGPASPTGDPEAITPEQAALDDLYNEFLQRNQ